ncbi:MAG: methylmalonyl-CoA epimerase [Methanobacteriota archaeon]|nr:MAG: methylmalonyl-CoA epimerase [Euryarchaeota archaeon]
MFNRIHHIGVAVSNLDDAVRRYEEELGFHLEGREKVESEEVEVAIFQVGESRIELLQSTQPDGIISRFIEKRGEGIHHLAVEVEDIERELTELKARGSPVLDEIPRIGAGGCKVAFIHPKGASGVLLELIEGSR